MRPAGGEAWLSVLSGCMAALGFTPEATRTALHRMAGEGWVEPRRVGRYAAYRLTERGFARLEEAAARIYRLRAAPWDHRWRLLIGPAIGRSPDLVRELTWLGFGRLSPDAWISPRSHGGRVDQLLQRHGLSQAVLAFDAAAGAHGWAAPSPDAATSSPPATADARIVATAWDLDGLRSAHRQFLDRWEGTEPPADDRAAFTTRLHLVHHWRSFLFLDPGLPTELLPADWLGQRAADVFRDLHEGLDARAWAYYRALVAAAPARQVNGRAPGSATAVQPDHRPDASPFAMGLAALETRRI